MIDDRVNAPQSFRVNQYTRRDALVRFALLSGAVVGGGFTAAASAGAQIGTPLTSGFTPRRRDIFRAVAEIYDGSGPIHVGSADLPSQLAARYGREYGKTQADYVDALLDAIDAAPDGAQLSQRALGDRRNVIRTWMRATEPADAKLARPRSTDAGEPSDIRESNRRNLKVIQAELAKVPPSRFALDAVTELPMLDLPTPPRPDIESNIEPTIVRLRRQLIHDSYVLTASLFLSDTRNLTVDFQ